MTRRNLVAVILVGIFAVCIGGLTLISTVGAGEEETGDERCSPTEIENNRRILAELQAWLKAPGAGEAAAGFAAGGPPLYTAVPPPAPQPAFLPDFESLVMTRRQTVDRGQTRIEIHADGTCVCKIMLRWRQAEGIEERERISRFHLSRERLEKLQEALRQAEWLRAQPKKGPPLTHVRETTFLLNRKGEQRQVTAWEWREGPYKELIHFEASLYLQEYLLAQLESGVHGDMGPTEACRTIRGYIEALRGEPGKIKPHWEIDYGRYVPWAKEIVRDYYSRPEEQVRGALTILGYCNVVSEVRQIAKLRDDRNTYVRDAVATALADLAKADATDWLVEMMDHSDRARFELMRLGRPALPTVLPIVRKGTTPGDIQSVGMVRAYIDHWTRLPPPDPQLVEAVREGLANTTVETFKEYYAEFLRLAEQGGPIEEDPTPKTEQGRRLYETVRANLEQVELSLVWDKGSKKDAADRTSLLLTTRDSPPPAEGYAEGKLRPEQVGRIVDALAAEGYFDRVTVHVRPGERMPLEPMPENPPGYLLFVSVETDKKYEPKWAMFEDLGSRERCRAILGRISAFVTGTSRDAVYKVLDEVRKDIHETRWHPAPPAVREASPQAPEGAGTSPAASGEPEGQGKLDFLSDVAEFRELDLTITEEKLQRMIAEKGLRNVTTQNRYEKTYHVYRSDGENVIVMFKGGECSGVQRMRKDTSYADKLFNGLGKAAKSLQVHLKADKTAWKVGEDLVLKADVSNVGQEDVALYIDGNNGWEIEVDGQWYRSEVSTTAHALMLGPGEQFQDISVPPVWTRPLQWRAKSDEDPGPGRGKLLTLEPGPHTVRVGVYPVMDSGPDGILTTRTDSGKLIRVVMPPQPTPGKPVRAVSNPIEILPAEAEEAAAQRAQEVSDESATWITLLPRSPIRSLREYRHTLKVVDPAPEPPLYRSAPIPACDFEIRRAKDLARVARIPYAGYFREHWEPGESDRRRIGDLAEEKYVVALCVGDVRLSNVAEVEINAGYDPAEEQPLRLVALETAPGQGIRYVGVRGTGPTPQDPKFGTWAVHHPHLIVDGVRRKVTMIVGSFFPMVPGVQFESIVDLGRYKPPIAPDEPHIIKATFNRYESNTVRRSANRPLGLAWDKATQRLPAAPSPRVVLRGKVTASDGKPAVGYEVGLSNLGGARFRERCDDQGRYEFVNIPAGEYSLHANPPGKGQPIVSIKKLEIEAEKTLVQDLSLARKFSFSGKVTYDDGTPAAGQEIMASWKSPDGRAEFDDFAVVDTDGRYTLSAPFPEASYVGVSGTGPRPNPHRAVKAGRTDVDFVIRKKPKQDPG